MSINSKLVLFGATTLLLLSTRSASMADGDANSCRSVPQLSGPYESGPFVVGTYHVTGVPGSDRVIEVSWPANLKISISGVPPERTDNAERTMIFDFARLTSPEYWGDMERLDFSVKISAVEQFPLYSRISNEGGQRSRGPVVRDDDGRSYLSSEGFEVIDRPFLSGWTAYRYPDARLPAHGQASFFRGLPTIEGVEAILTCRLDSLGAYSSCRMVKKEEPVFYEFRFNAEYLENLSIIEILSDQLVQCIFEGN